MIVNYDDNNDMMMMMMMIDDINSFSTSSVEHYSFLYISLE